MASFPGCQVCVVKLTAAGQIAWETPLYENAFFAAYPPLVVDPAGNVYLSGSDYKAFITWKLDPNGNVLWRTTNDPPDQTWDYPIGIGRDDASNVYVVGRSYDEAVQGAYSTVLKYDSDGHLLWARRYEGATNSIPNNVGTLAVNPRGGVAAISSRAVASYSAEGDLLWSLQAPLSNEVPPAMFDRNDHLFVASVEWVGKIAHSALTKFSPSGEVLWSAEYESPVEQGIRPFDLKIDALGQAYVAADSPISCYDTYDDGELFINCYVEPLIVKYSPQGEQLWASRFTFPTNLFPIVSGLALNSADEPYLASRVYRYDSANDNYESHEGFVAKCDGNGNQIWSGTYDVSQRQWSLSPGSPAPQTTWWIEYLLLLQFEGSQSPSAPRIIAPPKVQTAAVGSTVTFSVKATSAGHLSYQWRFNSQPVPGANEATLTLSGVQAAQAGDYSVEVRNKFGATVTPEARLSISN